MFCAGASLRKSRRFGGRLTAGFRASDFVQLHSEVPQDRRLERDAVAGGDFGAAFVDVAAGGGDHADVVVRIDPARDGQTQQFEPRIAVFVRVGICLLYTSPSPRD